MTQQPENKPAEETPAKFVATTQTFGRLEHAAAVAKRLTQKNKITTILWLVPEGVQIAIQFKGTHTQQFVPWQIIEQQLKNPLLLAIEEMLEKLRKAHIRAAISHPGPGTPQ